ncbi:MAG TPA: DUF4124 domain-containing protein [Burkholderiales bacterium]|nr:DUF4124 domain-containing protein [Burkholderiales bacterium]
MKILKSLAFAVLAAGSSAQAQVVYKSTMPDGKVIYTEKPVPGATRVDTIEPPPAKTGMSSLTPEEKARADEFAKKRAAAAATKGNDLDDARRQLKQAEAARETGKEPLPGERIGTAGGASRLTEAYQARQKTLDDAVETARKRLDQLQSGR